MFFLKIVLSIVVVLVGLLALAGVSSLFEKEFWNRPHKILFLATLVLWCSTSGLGAYALFIDWSFVSYAFSLFGIQIVAQWISLAYLSKSAGYGWSEFKPEIRSAVAGLKIGELRQHRPLEDALTLLKSDRRAPVLYLRSFARETKLNAWKHRLLMEREKLRSMRDIFASLFREKSRPGETDRAFKRTLSRRGIFGRLTALNIRDSLVSRRGGLFDEQLVIANVMNQIGPYVAIARPDERKAWRDVGAAKLEVADNQWQSVVELLITASAAIVIEAGNSEGLVWELEQVSKLAKPKKILILLPRSDSEYAGFRRRMSEIFPISLPSIRPLSPLMTFFQDWQPLILDEYISDADEAYMRASVAMTLRPFFEQNGFRVNQGNSAD